MRKRGGEGSEERRNKYYYLGRSRYTIRSRRKEGPKEVQGKRQAQTPGEPREPSEPRSSHEGDGIEQERAGAGPAQPVTPSFPEANPTVPPHAKRSIVRR